MYYLYKMNYVPDTDLGCGALLHYYSHLQQLWLDTRCYAYFIGKKIEAQKLDS